MADVKSHYDNLLATYYSWMFGGFELKLADNRKFFGEHGIQPKFSGVAMDLGAGCGFQSIPLAEAGFRVIAIDTSHALLAELKNNAGGLTVETVEDDLLNFSQHRRGEPELIVCMGDTLTHLDSPADVHGLFENLYQVLGENGRLVLTFRDLSAEMRDLERFIPVRSENNVIFTCFLEYEKKHVKVHDIVYEKTDDHWQMKKSFYRKLRIPPEDTRECLLGIGFEIQTFDLQDGMVTITARKG
jgi:SAM-dependent methyltransferase